MQNKRKFLLNTPGANLIHSQFLIRNPRKHKLKIRAITDLTILFRISRFRNLECATTQLVIRDYDISRLRRFVITIRPFAIRNLQFACRGRYSRPYTMSTE